VLAAAAVATFFAARALAPSSARGRSENGNPNSQATAVLAKPLPADATDALAWMQAASLADCEALLATQGVRDLPPLVREALFLRLAELDPRRLARLLLDKQSIFIGSREQWLTWLAKTHRGLLEEVAASADSPAVLKEYLQMTIARAEAEARKDPRQILEAALANGSYPRDHLALGKLADSDPHLAIDYKWRTRTRRACRR
jgi:hypothetical protein